jgi:nucleoid-associated protein YgaU
MPVRNNKRTIRINDNELYEEIFEGRSVKFIRQYLTMEINYPTPDQQMALQSVSHVWAIGDRFYKLAHEFYGDSRFWWVIAWYNKKPTEGHVQIGDVLAIPQPLSRVLRFFNK